MKSFVINKNEAEDRYLNFLSQGFPAERIEPVPLDDPELLSYYIPSKKPELKRKKELSNILTFRNIIQTVKDENHFLRFEDDVEFIHNPVPFIEEINSLPDDFGLCFLGVYFRPSDGQLEKYNESFIEFKTGIKTWGLHAVIINHTLYDIFSDVETIITYPCLDMYISKKVLSNFRCFSASTTLAIQSDKFIQHSIHSIKFNAKMFNASENQKRKMLGKGL